MKRECTYADQARVAPVFKCPPCAGGLTFRVQNYWVGAARDQYGPHMILCEAHGAWYNEGHIMGRAERVPAVALKAKRLAGTPAAEPPEGRGRAVPR